MGIMKSQVDEIVGGVLNLGGLPDINMEEETNIGDTIYYVDGQEATVIGHDEDGDIKVRKTDGSTSVWFWSKCTKAARKLDVGENVRYSSGEVAIIEGFDEDGDIKVRKRDGKQAIWYRKNSNGLEVPVSKPISRKSSKQSRYTKSVNFSKVGTQITWAEFNKSAVLSEKWYKDAAPSVKAKEVVEKEIGCSEFCKTKAQELKAKLPDHHRKTFEDIQAKANQHVEIVKAKAKEHKELVFAKIDENFPELKAKAGQHMEKAKENYREHGPVVKTKAKEGAIACYDFWTHPHTVDAMKTGPQTAVDMLRDCFAGCLKISTMLKSLN